jgi:hypothetical protein
VSSSRENIPKCQTGVSGFAVALLGKYCYPRHVSIFDQTGQARSVKISLRVDPIAKGVHRIEMTATGTWNGPPRCFLMFDLMDEGYPVE